MEGSIKLILFKILEERERQGKEHIYNLDRLHTLESQKEPGKVHFNNHQQMHL